jgi:hypothetical protein
MFELIMTFCLIGEPCEREVVAIFPQWDIGNHICDLAKPGIEMGIRSKVPAGTRVDFECLPQVEPMPNGLLAAPRGDVQFAKDGTPFDVVDLLKKVIPK